MKTQYPRRLSDATRLRRHRKRIGLTLVQLEKRSGVSDSMLSAIENGKRRLTHDIELWVGMPERKTN